MLYNGGKTPEITITHKGTRRLRMEKVDTDYKQQNIKV